MMCSTIQQDKAHPNTRMTIIRMGLNSSQKVTDEFLHFCRKFLRSRAVKPEHTCQLELRATASCAHQTMPVNSIYTTIRARFHTEIGRATCKERGWKDV